MIKRRSCVALSMPVEKYRLLYGATLPIFPPINDGGDNFRLNKAQAIHHAIVCAASIYIAMENYTR